MVWSDLMSGVKILPCTKAYFQSRQIKYTACSLHSLLPPVKNSQIYLRPTYSYLLRLCKKTGQDREFIYHTGTVFLGSFSFNALTLLCVRLHGVLLNLDICTCCYGICSCYILFCGRDSIPSTSMVAL